MKKEGGIECCIDWCRTIAVERRRTASNGVEWRRMAPNGVECDQRMLHLSKIQFQFNYEAPVVSIDHVVTSAPYQMPANALQDSLFLLPLPLPLPFEFLLLSVQFCFSSFRSSIQVSFKDPCKDFRIRKAPTNHGLPRQVSFSAPVSVSASVSVSISISVYHFHLDSVQDSLQDSSQDYF